MENNKNLNEVIKNLIEENNKLKKEVDYLQGYNNDLKKEVDKLSDENFEYYLDIEEINHIYEIDRTYLSDVKKENKQLKELIKNKDIYISGLSNNFTALQNEKNLLIKSCCKLDKQIEFYKSEIKFKDNTINNYSNEIVKHKNTIIELYEIIKENQ